jgi:hypothetical protein
VYQTLCDRMGVPVYDVAIDKQSLISAPAVDSFRVLSLRLGRAKGPPVSASESIWALCHIEALMMPVNTVRKTVSTGGRSMIADVIATPPTFAPRFFNARMAVQFRTQNPKAKQ